MRTLIYLGLLLLAIFGLLFAIANVIRFSYDVGTPPIHYAVEDGLLIVAGALVVAICLGKLSQLQGIEEKQRAEIAARNHEAATPSAEVSFHGNRLEAGIGPFATGLLLFTGLVCLALFLLDFQAVIVPALSTGRLPPARLLGAGLMVPLYAFCAAYLLTLARAYGLRGKPALVMDSLGLDHALFGPIPWDQIHSIVLRKHVSRRATHDLLLLGVSQPGRYLRHAPWSLRWFTSRQAMEATGGELRILLNHLSESPERIYAAARELRGRVQPPLLDFWIPNMTDDDIRRQREVDHDPGHALAHLARMQGLVAQDARQRSDRFWLHFRLAKVFFGIFVLAYLAYLALMIWRASNRH